MMSLEEIPKRIWNYLLSLVTDENADVRVDDTCGRMTRDEVLKIAVAAAKGDERLSHLVPKEVALCREGKTKRLLWGVRFVWDGIEDDYILGTMGFVGIDDQTGEVVSVDYVPR